MSTGTYDYTREQTGSTEDAEDLVIGGFAAPTRTADDIEKDNSFLDIPPGDHLVAVKGFAGSPKRDLYKVFVDGALAQFESYQVTVIFQLPGQPQYTVRDTFVLPPMDPREHRAYFEGKSKVEDKTGGFMASKFLHFIARIGFEYPAGGQLPPVALALKNWKGRAVYVTVQPGKDWTDKEGKARKGYNQIKLFSYRRVDGVAALAQGQGQGAAASAMSMTANGPAIQAPSATQQVAAPVAPAAPIQPRPGGAQSVLDNI